MWTDRWRVGEYWVDKWMNAWKERKEEEMRRGKEGAANKSSRHSTPFAGCVQT